MEPTRKGPIPQGPRRVLGWRPGAAGEEERSQFLMSPSSWVPWSPSEHTFSDCSIPPAPVATPAFPVSPLHLSSASTCLLSPVSAAFGTPTPGGHPDFSLHCCSSLVLPVMQETRVQSLGREDPWRRKRQPIPGFLLGESHGQRSLAGYSPWGRPESDTTERLTVALSLLLFTDTSLCPLNEGMQSINQ